MKTIPKRRWYQFSLRTMFVGLIVVSLFFAWVGYSLNWIRQRHALLRNPSWERTKSKDWDYPPAMLWLFGEHGVKELRYDGKNDKDLESARRLFPEARIVAEH